MIVSELGAKPLHHEALNARRAAAAATPMFPVFKADREARCYACDGALGLHADSGFADRGRRQGYCEACGERTFYDLVGR